jgi:ABC-type transport system involved in cytochrome c biogenesis ATPase subunit
MSEALFDIDVLRVPGRYWLTIAEKEDADVVIDRLAEVANQIEPGSLGVLEVKPVLINNLRAWENLILPRWYHHSGALHEHDAILKNLLQALDVDEEKLVLMLSKLPGQLDVAQRRVVAFLRVVLQHAPVWVIEEEWLEWWQDARGRNPMLAKIMQHIAMPSSLLVISTRAAQPTYQVVKMIVEEIE